MHIGGVSSGRLCDVTNCYMIGLPRESMDVVVVYQRF